MSLSLKDAARRVLVTAGEPLHYQEITKRIIDGNLSTSKSQTPAASVNAVITVDMKQNGTTSDFVRVEPGVIGLRNQGASVALSEVAPDESERRVRIPHFPPYDEVRRILPVWTGMARTEVTGLRSTIAQLRGTPQDPVDWSSLEHLVKRLLEEMNYDNVSVTSRSGDGGVDVVADIELGITSVREVVQAKRHKRTIQRKDLDALRGSLHRFGAVRGTIIATSKYSKGTREAAFEPGAAPITLIDGEKLIDLLIVHGIGVRKKTLEVLDLDAEVFAEVEESLDQPDEVAK